MKYPQWFEKLYNLGCKWLWWFQYKPADEREAQLFYKAYQRAFITLFVCILVLRTVADYLLFTSQTYNYALSGSLLISFLMGGKVFATDKDIQLKKLSFFGTGTFILVLVLAGILLSLIDLRF